MAETPSTMIPLGTSAPSFKLIDTCTNQMRSLADLKSDKATVVMFICNHCPFVKHIQSKLVEVANNYQKKGVNFIAISSNNAEKYPADSPDNMKKEAEAHDYPFPYLYDESQSVAKAYQAACTPDLYIFDQDLKCVYRGRFDDSRPGNNKPVTGADLTQALDQVLAGKSVNPEQHASVGCNIKWK